MNRLIERLKAGEEVECYVADHTDGDGVPDYSQESIATVTRYRSGGVTPYPFGGSGYGQIYRYAKPVAEDWRDNLDKHCNFGQEVVGVLCDVSDGVDAEGMVDYSQGATARITSYDSGLTFPYRGYYFGYRYARPKGVEAVGKKSRYADQLETLSYQAAIDQHPAFGGGTTSSGLPTDAKERKAIPVYTGFINYFPKAIAAVAKLSLASAEQHGQTAETLHWNRDLSGDELDAMMRHVLDGDWEQVAWRAMANLEKKLEVSE